LEAATDALAPDAHTALVLYVGDGWPTFGDLETDAIVARLARRPGGPVRLGAIALGPTANRFGLSALRRGTGPLFEIADGDDAARVATDLLSVLVQPATRGVSVDLGPRVERVHPRRAGVAASGDTVTVVGKLRGP